MKEVMIYFHYTFEDKQMKNILFNIFLSCKSTRQDESFPFVYAKFLPSECQSRKLPLQTSCRLCSCVALCSEDQFCRICHEGRASGELLSPCECAGSLASVHRSCLEQWLTASDSGHCELCHHQFVLERVPKPLTEVGPSPH